MTFLIFEKVREVSNHRLGDLKPAGPAVTCHVENASWHQELKNRPLTNMWQKCGHLCSVLNTNISLGKSSRVEYGDTLL
jgi:hypothetical protein